MIRHIFYAIALGALLSGCSTFGGKRSTLSDENNEIVAIDFVNALRDLRGHNPKNTMLQLRPAKTGFGKQLGRELRDAGYGIQTIAEGDTGPMLVTYQADSFENSAYKSVAYRLRVGGIELGREYEVRAGRVFPISSLSVKGVEIASQALDQSLFERTGQDGSEDWRVIQPGIEESILNERERYRSIVPTDRTEPPQVEILAQSSQSSIFRRSEEAQMRPQATVNMLMLGESNFAHIFKNYSVIKEDLVVFPNDSLNIGSNGKRQITRLLATFNPDTDLISVVGCSHGKTKIRNGNKTLALGRAKRVVDELLLHAVPADRVYDEGCWAGVEQKSLPARGVIMTLRREKKPA